MSVEEHVADRNGIHLLSFLTAMKSISGRKDGAFSYLDLHVDSERQGFRSVNIHLGCLRPDGRAAPELEKEKVILEPESVDPSIACGQTG